MVFFPKGGGVPAEPKVLRHFFCASKPPKGQKGKSKSFEAVLR